MSISEKDASVKESQAQYIENIKRISESRLSIQSNNGSVGKDLVKNFCYEDVLNIIGFGRTQYLMLFTCGLLLMMVICETMGMSIITIASKCDFNTNSVEMAVMSAAAFIGEFLL